MHTDLSQQLHTSECNDLIKQLAKCHADHPFKKFFGACNLVDTQLNKCLKGERLARRARNSENSTKAKNERLAKYGK